MNTPRLVVALATFAAASTAFAQREVGGRQDTLALAVHLPAADLLGTRAVAATVHALIGDAVARGAVVRFTKAPETAELFAERDLCVQLVDRTERAALEAKIKAAIGGAASRDASADAIVGGNAPTVAATGDCVD
jgi:hypothetical protein